MHRISSDQWAKMPLTLQLSNIGSEAERAIGWKARKQKNYSEKSFERVLEMLDLTIADRKNMSGLKELARIKEVFIDYIMGNNSYNTSPEIWTHYFSHFYLAARRRV